MMETLKKMSLCISPSGHEKTIREMIKESVGDLADEVTIDPLGNLIVHKKGPGKKIMVSSHMDEIGFMVTFAEEEGFLRFCAIGGIAAKNMVHTKVVFQNGVVGVIGADGDVKEEKDLTFDKMFIDIGASSKDEALSMVGIGDVCGFYTKFAIMGDHICSKSLDDRIACYIAVETLKNLKECPNDVYFVFSTQEELGLRGAKTAAFTIEPDMGIALDVTNTGDLPKSPKMDVKLGGGAAIKIKDGYILCHRAVVDMMKDVAKRENIKYQLEVLAAGGTDVGAIHLSKSGVPSGGISIPCRYVHSPSEMVNMRDVVECTKLLTAILQTAL